MIRRNRIVGGRRLWRIGLNLAIALCLAIAIVVVRLPAMAEITQAEIIEILDGSEVTIDNQPAKVNDVARFGQQLRTGNSRVGLVFDNGAAARLGPNSSLNVGQCLELQQGQGVFAGPANGCTSGVVAGVQGTIYILEQEQESDGKIKVIEGEVALEQRDNPESLEPVNIRQGEKAAISNDKVGEVERLQAWEFGDILRGILFRGFVGRLPGQERLKGVCKDLFPGLPCPNAGAGERRGLPF